MDATSRAELETLRRRAYSPDADIDDDPVALARLEELEGLVRDEHLVASLAVAVAVPDAASSAGQVRAASPADAVPHAAPPTVPPARAVVAGAESRDGRRWRWIAVIAAAVVVGAAAIVLTRFVTTGAPEAVTDPIESREAYTLARDDTAFTLLRIPIRAAFDDGVDLPEEPLPAFPASGEVEWAEPLGEYFGWNLWIAGASGTVQREHCLLAERQGAIRARCVAAVLRAQSALVVTLPYRMIPREQRPQAMDRDERIGFWWNADSEVTVLLADDPGDETAAPEAIPLAATFARRFTDAPETQTLLYVPLAAEFDETRRGAEEEPVPAFPADEALRWSDGLGRFFGTELWRADVSNGERCLLVELPTITRASCVDAEAFAANAMLVIVAFDELSPDDRPSHMTADQALGFHWRGDARLDILLGPSPYATAAD